MIYHVDILTFKCDLEITARTRECSCYNVSRPQNPNPSYLPCDDFSLRWQFGPGVSFELDPSPWFNFSVALVNIHGAAVNYLSTSVGTKN